MIRFILAFLQGVTVGAAVTGVVLLIDALKSRRRRGETNH